MFPFSMSFRYLSINPCMEVLFMLISLVPIIGVGLLHNPGRCYGAMVEEGQGLGNHGHQGQGHGHGLGLGHGQGQGQGQGQWQRGKGQMGKGAKGQNDKMAKWHNGKGAKGQRGMLALTCSSVPPFSPPSSLLPIINYPSCITIIS